MVCILGFCSCTIIIPLLFSPLTFSLSPLYTSISPPENIEKDDIDISSFSLRWTEPENPSLLDIGWVLQLPLQYMWRYVVRHRELHSVQLSVQYTCQIVLCVIVWHHLWHHMCHHLWHHMCPIYIILLILILTKLLWKMLMVVSSVPLYVTGLTGKTMYSMVVRATDKGGEGLVGNITWGITSLL